MRSITFTIVFLTNATLMLAQDGLILFEYFKLKCDGSEYVENDDIFNDFTSVGAWTKSSTYKGKTSGPVMINMDGKRLFYADYIGSEKGNAMQISYINQTNSITTDTKRGSSLCFTDKPLSYANSVYTAFLVDLSNHPNTTEEQEIFDYHKSGGISRGRIFVKFSSSESRNVVLGIKYNNESISNWSTPVSVISPILLVVKYTKKILNDSFELFVNPTTHQAEENQTENFKVSGGKEDLRFVSFYMENKRIMKIGSIRIAKTFIDAVSSFSSGAVHPTENPMIVRAYNNSLYFEKPFEGIVYIYSLGGTILQESKLEHEESVRCFLGNGIFLVRTISSKNEINTYKIYFDK